jgi:hypothetical protein
MSDNSRDDFSELVKRTLASRVGSLCSNPKCKQSTSGPSESEKAVTNVGVAAHITAASVGGPRYDSSLTSEQRSSINNGIWLCQKCAKAVDDDPVTYTEKLLNDWKTTAEDSARRAIEEGPQDKTPAINVIVLVHKAYFIGNPVQHYFIKITNAMRDIDLVVTHIWYESDDFSLDIITLPLPLRLKPAELVETWIPVEKIPDNDNVFNNFKIILSTGETFSSRHNLNVRPAGRIGGQY